MKSNRIPSLVQATIFMLGLGLAGGAAAHSNEYLDTLQAPHGGQLRMAGNYHYELVIKPVANGGPNEVLVYLTDHASVDVPTKGATGTVTILSKSKANVDLKPEGVNLMRGSASFDVNPNLKAVVSVTLPGQAAEQARFTPFASKQAVQAAQSNPTAPASHGGKH